MTYLKQLGSRALPSVGPPLVVTELVLELTPEFELNEELEEELEEDEKLEVEEDELDELEDELVEIRTQALALLSRYPLTHSIQTLVKALDLRQLGGKL